VPRAEGWLSRPDGEGLLNQLAKFSAYRDPVRKKTVFFLALMRNLKLWDIADSNNLAAPVDYHEVRGHLRCGTVEILDPDLATRIRSGVGVSEDEDVAIRGAVSDAIMEISRSTRLSPSSLHYLFWNVFRACCKRDVTHCEGCPVECELPERYAALTLSNRACVFSSVCASRGLSNKLVEHHFRTDFY
jgi:hypothetical protein